MKRWFSKRQRQILLLIAGGKCQLCGKKLKKNFHADHIRPFSKGGKTITNNGQALCSRCNTSKGNKNMKNLLGIYIGIGSLFGIPMSLSYIYAEWFIIINLG